MYSTAFRIIPTSAAKLSPLMLIISFIGIPIVNPVIADSWVLNSPSIRIVPMIIRFLAFIFTSLFLIVFTPISAIKENSKRLIHKNKYPILN